MMRKSNRSQIIDAAFRVIEREGVTAMTYESVAAEAGLTKGGLLYHFPSREALLEGLHAHLADQWEELLTDTMGKPAAQATPDERFAAYARATAHSASRADLLLLLESVDDETLRGVWAGFLAQWAAPVPSGSDDDEGVRRFISRLAADGLWLYEALAGEQLPWELRTRIADQIADL